MVATKASLLFLKRYSLSNYTLHDKPINVDGFPEFYGKLIKPKGRLQESCSAASRSKAQGGGVGDLKARHCNSSL